MELSPEVWVNIFSAVLLLLLTAFFFRPNSGSSKSKPSTASTASDPKGNGTGSAASLQAHPNEDKSRASLTPQESSAVKDTLPTDSIPKGASAASPAEDELKDKQLTLYSGAVKRYSERNGMGFVSCDALREEYGVDVRIFREEVDRNELQVGDLVQFRMKLGGRPQCRSNHPWATHVTKVGTSSAEPGPAPLASAEASRSCTGLRADAAAWHPSAEEPEDNPSALPARTRLDPSAADFIPSAAAPTSPQASSNRSNLNAAAAEFVPQALGTDTLQ